MILLTDWCNKSSVFMTTDRLAFVLHVFDVISFQFQLYKSCWSQFQLWLNFQYGKNFIDYFYGLCCFFCTQLEMEFYRVTNISIRQTFMSKLDDRSDSLLAVLKAQGGLKGRKISQELANSELVKKFTEWIFWCELSLMHILLSVVCILTIYA